MNSYEDILTDPEVVEFQRKLPDYNDVVRIELGYAMAKKIPPDEAKRVLIAVLSDLLQAYSKTESTTNAGRVFRRIAELLSYINPMRWLRSNSAG